LVVAIAVAPLLLCSRCTLLLVTQYPPSHVCPLLCDPVPSPYIQLLRTLHGPQAYEMARARSMTGAEGGAAAGAGGGGGGGGVGGGGAYPGPGDGGGAGASTQTGFGGADMPPPQGDGACVCSALVTGALFEKTHMPMSCSGYICCLRLAAPQSFLPCMFMVSPCCHRAASGRKWHDDAPRPSGEAVLLRLRLVWVRPIYLWWVQHRELCVAAYVRRVCKAEWATLDSLCS
jgi:hypothetical protein